MIDLTLTTTVTQITLTAVEYPSVTLEVTVRSADSPGGSSGEVDHVSNVATGTILGRATAGTGNSEELTASQARTVMGLGTAATTPASDYLQAGSGFNTADGWLKLDGDGTVPDIRIPSSIARDTEVAAAVAAKTVDVVSNVATSTILGRATAGSGDSEELTVSQVKTLLALTASDVGAQPSASELTALAALSGTAYGRGFITLADHAALITKLALVAADIPNLSASQITLGTMATARLGSGTASAATFLRGDQTYAIPVPTPDLVWATDTYILMSKQHGVGYAATANGSVATSAGMMHYYSWVVPVTMNVKGLALPIETANAGASAVWRAGLYADNGSGLPGTVIVDGGTASINSTGVRELSFSPVTLTAGQLIWFVSGFQGFTTGTNPQYSGVLYSSTSVAETGPVAGSGPFGVYEKTGVTGAFGNNPAPSIMRNIRDMCPHLWLKVA